MTTRVNTIAWKLCTTMRADDVTDTLELALVASGCDSAKVVHKPRLLSDNGEFHVAAVVATVVAAFCLNQIQNSHLAADQALGDTSFASVIRVFR